MASGRRILVFGGTGQLGTALVHQLTGCGCETVAPARRELDLLHDDPAVAIEQVAPAAVVNAAAYNDVNGAELDEHREQVSRLNRDAPARMAWACSEREIPFVHVSTDYVFDGRASRPYREDDAVGPLQAYGVRKLEGERMVLAAWPRALVARTSTVFGVDRRGGSNYLDAILAQARTADRIDVVRLPVSSPTYAPDLAAGLIALLDAGSVGVVHVVNGGGCSRLELAAETVRAAGLDVVVRERPAPTGGAERPAYSVLDTSRYTAATGRAPRPWQEAVCDHVRFRTA